MNKIAQRGRWIVAAAFAFGGLSFFFGRGMPSLMRGLRGKDTFYPFYMAVIFSLPFLFCAWGLLSWRLWAYKLAVILSMFEILSLVVALAVVGMSDVDRLIVYAAIFAFAPLAWLLFPPVRAEYRQRNHLA